MKNIATFGSQVELLVHAEVDRGVMDRVPPRSRGSNCAWGNLVWARKDANARKGKMAS